MSWNPRRMVDFVKGASVTKGNPSYVWLTPDAVTRVGECEAHQAVWQTEVLPSESLIIGLGAPVPTTYGDASLLLVPGVETARMALTQSALKSSDPRYAKDMMNQAARLPDEVVDANRTIAVHARNNLRQLASTVISMPDWRTQPLTKEEAETERAAAVEYGHDVQFGLLYGEDIDRILYLVRAAWTLLNEPDEREFTATTVDTSSVTVGRNRKARNLPVQVVDIRRPAAGSGGNTDLNKEPLDHQYRWYVKGHPRLQWFGSGDGRFQRPIWIDQHVRGPEDKPIKPRVTRIHGGDID